MKDIVILLCTPDMYRPVAGRCIEFLKKTNLARAELIIADNAYDRHFKHAGVMGSFIEYAGHRPIIFIDDDVLIKDYEWISKLLKIADQTDSPLVGCLHEYESGEINHSGIVVHMDGTPELIRMEPDEVQYSFRPAVSSALILLNDPVAVQFDLAYKKYQHDVDICLQIWSRGGKVVCSHDLRVIHHLTEYTSTLPQAKRLFEDDTNCFSKKWSDFVKSELYKKEDLSYLKDMAKGRNWTIYYNEGSRVEENDPGVAGAIFKNIIEECPFHWLKAGASFHLYGLDNNIAHLKNCLRFNPKHKKAGEILESYGSS